MQRYAPRSSEETIHRPIDKNKTPYRVGRVVHEGGSLSLSLGSIPLASPPDRKRDPNKESDYLLLRHPGRPAAVRANRKQNAHE